MANGIIYNASFDSTTRVLSLLDKAGNVISSCEVPSKSKELTLTATADNSSVTLTKVGTLSNTFEVNTGSGWTAYTFGTVINLNAGQSCKWRCSAHPTTQSNSNYVKFVMTGTIEASGNCNSILSSDFDNRTSLYGYNCAFSNLFQGCTALTKAPELPATTLSSSCYYDMFYGCTALTKAPELPAKILSSDCYTSMFQGCTALTKAPELPAKTLPSSCYSGMFSGCTALTKAPELPATTLSSYCYSAMFRDCTALTKAPDLPATTLSNFCYSGMFVGCTALTKAPELPAKTLPSYCYLSMFQGCTSLAEVRIAATTTATDALQIWLKKVSPTGDFYCSPNKYFQTDSENGIPIGWERWVYGAEDTGKTTTMYHNGVAETVLVGTSSYGACYALQGWAGFKTLSEMHAFGYTFGAQVSTTVYHNGSTTTIDKIEANGADGFTEDRYIVNSACNTLTQMHEAGYTLGAQTAITMYYYIDPVSAYSCVANVEDGFTETMYDVGDGEGYLTITQQNAKSYYLVSTEFNGLILTATADNSSVALTKNGTLSNTYEVNTGDGSGWQSYTFGTTINLNNGDKCRWRCSNHPTTQSDSNYVKFVMTGTIEASGNCNSILSSDFDNMTSLSGYNYAFRSLFNDCTALTKAPELPATTLSNFCYYYMFVGCTALTKAPELPATTLSSYCYMSMFSRCTALTKAPELPATTLSSYCYVSMFSVCTALTKAPELPATTLSGYCYKYMFYGCTSLAEVRIAATTSVTDELANWLEDVAATGDFYCNPNATIFPSGISGIPIGWERWVYGAEDTGTTATMYHNGVAETVRVGTSDYGACYSAQGWAGFQLLAQMHALGYTLGAQTPLTMYHGSDPVSAYSCDANVNDSFTETMYDVGDGNGYLDIATQNANGYTLTAPNP